MSAPPNGPAAAGRRPPLAAVLLFVVAVIFTLVGLVEAAFVGYDAWTNGSLSVFRAPDLERGIRSWTEHHAMRPGWVDSAARLNSFGLRSPEVAVPKPAGTGRVLMLGDSFTFGFKTSEHDAFPRRLEGLLRSATGDDRIEVINAGVVSYSPVLEYLQYKHHLHVLEPDVVVLNFDMSDVQDHMLYARSLVSAADGTPLYATEPSLGQRASAMPVLLSVQWAQRMFAAVTRRWDAANEDSPFVRDLDRYLWTLDGEAEWRAEAAAAMAPIASLKTLLAHHGIPLVLATYPQPWQVSADATSGGGIREQYGVGAGSVHLNDRPFRMLEAFAAGHGIPFVNATADFRQAADPTALFLETDFHFSARGNTLYAEVLARELERLGLPSAAPR